MTASLLDPIALGAIAAPNRIVMAPLTRGRAGPGFVPNDLARDYYRQRASAGLIVSEATGISQEGLGWPSAPGLWTDAQVEGWKPEIGRAHVCTPVPHAHLVCRLVLEKKNNIPTNMTN